MLGSAENKAASRSQWSDFLVVIHIFEKCAWRCPRLSRFVTASFTGDYHPRQGATVASRLGERCRLKGSKLWVMSRSPDFGFVSANCPNSGESGYLNPERHWVVSRARKRGQVPIVRSTLRAIWLLVPDPFSDPLPHSQSSESLRSIAYFFNLSRSVPRCMPSNSAAAARFPPVCCSTTRSNAGSVAARKRS